MTQSEKVCTGCRERLPLAAFGPNRRGRLGLAAKCRACTNEQCRNRYAIVAEKRRDYSRKWYAQNRDAILAARKARPEIGRKATAKWRECNRDRARAMDRERYRKQAKNPDYIVRDRVSRSIRKALKSDKGNASVTDVIGYSIHDLKSHLERQFLRGMSWGNMGEWHIDHIIPLSSFNFSSPNDPEIRRAWALSNLRPLWARDNMMKHAKRDFLL